MHRVFGPCLRTPGAQVLVSTIFNVARVAVFAHQERRGRLQLGFAGGWCLDRFRRMHRVFGLVSTNFNVVGVRPFAHPQTRPSALSFCACFVAGVTRRCCARGGGCVRTCIGIGICLCLAASCLRAAFKRLDLEHILTPTPMLFRGAK